MDNPPDAIVLSTVESLRWYTGEYGLTVESYKETNSARTCSIA